MAYIDKNIFRFAIFCLLIPITLSAHDYSSARDEGAPDYAERAARVRYLNQHVIAEGLGHKATLKLQEAAWQARGGSIEEFSAYLLGGPLSAFPYLAAPELPSTGDVETLTILIEFNDHQGAGLLPTRQQFWDNIYGAGTVIGKHHTPYESVNAYYRRASEGLVEISGEVLDWYHFPNDRNTYEPAKAPAGPNQETHQSYLDNSALFKLVDEALSAADADHDFSQYDNDLDGDIDLVTILYAGPKGGWGSFWWAYRWEFFVQEANNAKFDGKRVRQFVFQFVDVHKNTNDFNPLTLIHETGHAFGLPDYYDYDPNIGPPGGIGGLDMMDANWGNHSAFSRWLLDWIQPRVLSADETANFALVASGLSGVDGDKAIAVFPGLADSSAPTQEMFIIENRHRVGNDGNAARTPGDGLLIWHVDASAQLGGVDFKYDNSFADRKIIRLVRSDSASDFLHGERANANTYFRAPRVFTKDSVPSSINYDGFPTNVAITNVSGPSSVLTADIGIEPAAKASVAVLPDPPPPPIQSLAPSGDSQSKEPGLVDFYRDLTSKSSAEFAELWREMKTVPQTDEQRSSQAVKRRMLISLWAGKDGPAALTAVAADSDDDFVRNTYPAAMSSWLHNDPNDAADWFFSENHAATVARLDSKIDARFVHALYAHLGLVDLDGAIQSLDELDHVNEIAGAIGGLEQAGELMGQSLDAANIQRVLDRNQETTKQLLQFRNAVKGFDLDSIRDRKQQEEIHQMLQQLAP